MYMSSEYKTANQFPTTTALYASRAYASFFTGLKLVGNWSVSILSDRSETLGRKGGIYNIPPSFPTDWVVPNRQGMGILNSDRIPSALSAFVKNASGFQIRDRQNMPTHPRQGVSLTQRVRAGSAKIQVLSAAM